MDIVTHALIGSATVAGIWHTQPVLACGVLLGNVAPDLDALTRLGGKQVFLRFHQSYSHSLGAVAIPLVAWLAFVGSGSSISASLCLGLAIGMVMHIGMDLTNTYGVRFAWPLSRRRFALNWIFFIDAPILALSIVALFMAWLAWNNDSAMLLVSSSLLVFLVLIIAGRAMIASRASQLARSAKPTARQTAIVPTTWVPWNFLLCYDLGETSETHTLNALTGETHSKKTISVLDAQLPTAILELPEWQVMRELSPHYHAVERSRDVDGGETIVCRDLRIRNFDTRFGTLTCRLNEVGQLVSKRWEV